MRSDVIIRRAAPGDTAKTVLDILHKYGPLPRIIIYQRTGHKVDQTLKTLEKKGLIRSFDAPNDHNNKKHSYSVVKYFEFVMYPIKKEQKEKRCSQETLKRYAKILESHGFTVIPPNAELKGASDDR